ncbi:MAG TPA: hypothetical protein VGL82_16480 [Bryobacteraceae bacterium]
MSHKIGLSRNPSRQVQIVLNAGCGIEYFRRAIQRRHNTHCCLNSETALRITIYLRGRKMLSQMGSVDQGLNFIIRLLR